MDAEGEWRWSYVDRTGARRSRPDEPEPQCENDDIVWEVSVSSTWVAVLEEGVLKMETMEIFVHSILVPGRLESLVDSTGLPGKVVQILQVSLDEATTPISARMLVWEKHVDAQDDRLIADRERDGGYDRYF